MPPVACRSHGAKSGKKSGMSFDFARKNAGRRKMPVGFMKKLKKFQGNWLVKLTNPVADGKLRFYIDCKQP